MFIAGPSWRRLAKHGGLSAWWAACWWLRQLEQQHGSRHTGYAGYANCRSSSQQEPQPWCVRQHAAGGWQVAWRHDSSSWAGAGEQCGQLLQRHGATDWRCEAELEHWQVRARHGGWQVPGRGVARWLLPWQQEPCRAAGRLQGGAGAGAGPAAAAEGGRRAAAQADPDADRARHQQQQVEGLMQGRRRAAPDAERPLQAAGSLQRTRSVSRGGDNSSQPDHACASLQDGVVCYSWVLLKALSWCAEQACLGKCLQAPGTVAHGGNLAGLS